MKLAISIEQIPDNLGGVPLTDREFKGFQSLVYNTCRIKLTNEKKELLRNRLGKRMRELAMKSFKDYYDRIMDDKTGQELTFLLDAISTNLTFFFREHQHFEFLSDVFVPQYLVGTPRGNSTLRVWSAACSSGEEPYSLAMCLTEAFGGHPLNLKILATDLSTRMLSRAREGIYTRQRVQAVPRLFQTKYFDSLRDGNVQINQSTRNLITFGRLNLMGNFPFSHKFDVIFCRNVMIYFDRPTQEQLVVRLAGCLNKGGYLFLGHSESLTGLKHGLTYVRPTVYTVK